MPVIFPRVYGAATLTRAGRHETLVVDGAARATMRPPSWIKVYLGSGQEIVLPDGTRWRLMGTQCGRAVCPVIVSERGRLALASPGVKYYLITGLESAYVLHPAEKPRWGKALHWILREQEVNVADIDLSKLAATVYEPISLAAVILCFAVIRLGIPGEGDTGVPGFRWG